MRVVCSCGQAVKLPDRPGRFACPACRKPLPTVLTGADEIRAALSIGEVPDPPSAVEPPKPSGPTPDRKRLGMIAGGVLVVLVVVLALASGKGKPGDDKASVEADKPNKADRPDGKASVEADDLDKLPLVGLRGQEGWRTFRDFEDNETAAERKYKGRRVEIMDVVGMIRKSKSDPGKVVVVFGLDGIEDGRGVYCLFDDPEELAQLKAHSQYAVIQGVVSSFDADEKILYLRRCRLEAIKVQRGDPSTGGIVGGNLRYETVWERKAK